LRLAALPVRERLLVLSNGYYPDRSSGTPYWCALLAKELSAEHDVTVLASASDAPLPPLPPRRTAIGGVAVWQWREPVGTYSDPVRQTFRPELDGALARVLDTAAPARVLALNFAGTSSTIAALLARRGTPLSFFVNDVAPFCLAGYFNKPAGACLGSDGGADCGRCAHARGAALASPLLLALRRYAGRLLDAFAAVASPSRWFADRLSAELGDGGHPERFQVVPYGLPPAPAWTRGPRSGPLRLGFFGGDDPRKGGALLLEALARVGSAPYELRWYGGRVPPVPAGVDARRIVRCGLVDVPRLLDELARAIDVAVFPSYGEVFPLTMLQALQAGVPVVASALGGYDERLQHGGNALLVPPGDPAALAEALGAVLSGRVPSGADPSLVPPLAAAVDGVRRMLCAPVPGSLDLRALQEAQDDVVRALR
jgi:glycosyltransferase involved in cell wall biosynthesis